VWGAGRVFVSLWLIALARAAPAPVDMQYEYSPSLTALAGFKPPLPSPEYLSMPRTRSFLLPSPENGLVLDNSSSAGRKSEIIEPLSLLCGVAPFAPRVFRIHVHGTYLRKTSIDLGT
jgi:hypothetical protein